MFRSVRVARPLSSWFVAIGIAVAQASPTVVSLAPANGSDDVAATTTELRIVFDRDMDGGTSVGPAAPGVPLPTVVGKVAWLDPRTLTIPVRLEPDIAYGGLLNGAGTQQLFRDRQGHRLAPTLWRFATCGTDGPIDQPHWNEQALAAMQLAVLERYSYRERTGTSWDAVFARGRAELLAATDRDQWVARAAAMLAPAGDPHLWFRSRGAIVGTHQLTAPANVNVRLLPHLLPGLRQINNNVLQARTADDIGYLLVATFDRDREADVLAAQQALAELRDCQALVLDVRPNGGGDEVLARSIAAWFVDGESVYAAHRSVDRTVAGGFGPVLTRTIAGNADPDRRFTGRVAVLMGPHNLSSCEAFLLMLRQCPRATLVGARSAGSSGNPQPVAIGAGVTLMVPSWQALRPDGSCFEGEGIAPDLDVATTAAELRERDPVLERALELLRRPPSAAVPATTTPAVTHRVLLQGNGRLVILARDGSCEWEMPWGGIHDLHRLPNGHVLVQEDMIRIVEIDPTTHARVWSYDASQANGNDGRRVEVHSFVPLPEGQLLVAESGPARLLAIDRSGRATHTIPLLVTRPDPHRDTRLVRRLASGNYLVCHEGDGVVREYDSNGAVVWEYAVPLFGREPKDGHGPEAFGNQVFAALRLPSGHTLIATGNGHSVLEVDAAQQVVWSVQQDDLPGIRLAWVTTLEVLPNGHRVVGNCHAGAGQPVLIEIEPATKQVVWQLDAFARFGNSVSNSLLLDVDALR